MSTIEEIEAAIQRLSDEQVEQVAQWLEGHRQQRGVTYPPPPSQKDRAEAIARWMQQRTEITLGGLSIREMIEEGAGLNELGPRLFDNLGMVL